MKRLTAQLKQALAALAYADAGEMLTGSEKDRVLNPDRRTIPPPAIPTPPPQPAATVSVLSAVRSHIGLYLGATLAPAVLRYAADSCRQANAALTVVTFQSEDTARAMLDPYLDELGRAGVVWRIARLRGEPRASLARYLKGEPRMLFLVATEAGFLGHSLLARGGARVDLGLPVVLVATSHAPVEPHHRTAAAG